jgi:hypothetical protein
VHARHNHFASAPPPRRKDIKLFGVWDLHGRLLGQANQFVALACRAFFTKGCLREKILPST